MMIDEDDNDDEDDEDEDDDDDVGMIVLHTLPYRCHQLHPLLGRGGGQMSRYCRSLIVV